MNLFKELYAEPIKKNDVFYTFFNENTVRHKEYDIISMMNTNSITDIYNKLEQSKNILSQTHIIMDISIINEKKGEPILADSKAYIAFFAVSYDNYNKNKIKYDILFKNSINKINELNNLLNNFKDNNESALLDYINNLKYFFEVDNNTEYKLYCKYENIIKLSKLDNNNIISVYTDTFFSHDLKMFCLGGAERYIFDLADICKSLGYKLRVYQKSEFDFVRIYNSLEVVGISCEYIPSDLYEYSIYIMQRFYYLSLKHKLCIMSAFSECIKKLSCPVIGISHGINWDNETNLAGNLDQNLGKFKWLIDTANNCNSMVSVDINTINWFQTLDYNLSQNITFIPNYVDLSVFNVSDKTNIDYMDKKAITILFPRRICRARGVYLVLDVIDNILDDYPNVNFHFVGNGYEADFEKLKIKQNKYKNRIQIYSLNMNDMHEAYEKADITLIPSLYSEGISLSCLEAMASKNAIISSRVGGLSNIIIDGFNGKLISPNAEELNKAIRFFLDNTDVMKKYSNNAFITVEAFNKNIWIERWKNKISNYILNLDDIKLKKYELVYIFSSVKSIMSDKVLNIINKNISHDYIIYIITNDEKYKKFSFGRLQFVFYEENLEEKPSKVYIDKNIEYTINTKFSNVDYF